MEWNHYTVGNWKEASSKAGEITRKLVLCHRNSKHEFVGKGTSEVSRLGQMKPDMTEIPLVSIDEGPESNQGIEGTNEGYGKFTNAG